MNPLEISPEEFRRLAERAVQDAARYLKELERCPVFPETSGEQTTMRFDKPAPEAGMGERAFDEIDHLFHDSRAGNGRFFGYVFGSGEPVAAIGDLLASVVNQNGTAWRSGPAAVTIERSVVGWLAAGVGCSGYVGSLCGGGSAANTMGLAMAREAKAPANRSGAHGGVVYASEQVHMSIPKAMALLGMGTENLRLVATDNEYRMRPDALESAVAADKGAGKKIVAVIATAGTVNTGAVDPLGEIAGIARRYDAWLHVDGAYGALAALAIPERFSGLTEADSLSLDGHKWLYQPVDCGCILYRDRAAAQRAFSNTGDYARALSQDPVEGFAFFEESMELSRRFRALKLWLSLRYHGFTAFREAIRRDLEHAQRLAEGIAAEPRLELVARGSLSAVCFRCRGESAEFNQLVLKRVVERGRVYLSNATLRGQFCLRACFVNHRTTDADVDAVVEEVLAAAADLKGSRHGD